MWRSDGLVGRCKLGVMFGVIAAACCASYDRTVEFKSQG